MRCVVAQRRRDEGEAALSLPNHMSKPNSTSTHANRAGESRGEDMQTLGFVSSGLPSPDLTMSPTAMRCEGETEYLYYVIRANDRGGRVDTSACSRDISKIHL